MPKIKYHNQVIEYTLSRKARRNVNFRIRTNGELLVSAPRRVSQTDIEKMIYQRGEWIIENQEKTRNKKQNQISEDIQNGNVIFLNGRKYYMD